jgi:glycosyltransferase involved in cell wall biosynthesis
VDSPAESRERMLYRSVSVVHFGPHPETVGGIQSVLRVLTDHCIGADSAKTCPTWAGPNHVRNAYLVVRAARTIVQLPSQTVVHFHMANRGSWLRDGPLATFARSRGLRVVFSLHAGDFPRFADQRPGVVGAILRRAHHIIAVSEEARQAAHARAPGVPVDVCPNPVELDAASLPADQTPPLVLFAGRVTHRKGVDVLLNAWRALIREGVEGECRLIGPRGDIDVPNDLPGLRACGPVHPREVRALVRGARVVVLPSREEAMPMILTEAMACGRPFVATAVGGNRMLAPRPDELLRVGDVEGLAAALRGYLTDPSHARAVGEEGRAYCQATRSPEVIGRRLRLIYES